MGNDVNDLSAFNLVRRVCLFGGLYVVAMHLNLRTGMLGSGNEIGDDVIKVD